MIALPVSAQKVRKRDTIESLENKTVAIRPGTVIVNSSDKARDNYRAFLDLVSNDPELRALLGLLIEKGIITQTEYSEKLKQVKNEQ